MDATSFCNEMQAKMFPDKSKESFCERYNKLIKIGLATAAVFGFVLMLVT